MRTDQTGTSAESAPSDPNLSFISFSAESAWREYNHQFAQQIFGQWRIEHELMTGAPFTLDGYCYPCHRATRFQVDYRYSYKIGTVLTPNWREQLLCDGCGLNNRMRAVIHGFEQLFRPGLHSRVLLAEQVTGLYQWLHVRYSDLTGCEYLGDLVALGQRDANNVRNEDLTRLTFDACEFDFVLAFDVFEHVPSFLEALRECYRVLKRGGHLFFSVPFRFDSAQNIVRAVRRPGGSIRHILPPEYHGDPLRREDCLAFYHFGWQLLNQLREAGFVNPCVQHYWSRKFGYLGAEQSFIVADRLPS
jgi:SAM-dependent methyltransferase